MKVSKSDVVSTKNNIDSFCGSTNKGNDKTSSSINDFVSYSGMQLQGKAWDLVRAKMSCYSDALDIVKYACNALQNASDSANLSMINYLTPYDSFDNSKIEEIREQIESLKQSISKLNSMMYEQELIIDPDTFEKEDKIKKYYVFKYSDAERRNFGEEIVALEAQVKKLEELLVRVEGLANKDKELFEYFASFASNYDVDGAVDSIPVTKID